MQSQVSLIHEISDEEDLKHFMKKNIDYKDIVVMWFHSSSSDESNAVAPRVEMVAKNFKSAIFLKMGFVFEDPPDRTYRFHVDSLPSFLILESNYGSNRIQDVDITDVNKYLGFLVRIQIKDIDIDLLIVLLKKELRNYFSVIEEISNEKELKLFWEYKDKDDDRIVVYWFYSHSNNPSKEIESAVTKLANKSNHIKAKQYGFDTNFADVKAFLFLKMDAEVFGVDMAPTLFCINNTNNSEVKIVSLDANFENFDINKLITLLQNNLEEALKVQKYKIKKQMQWNTPYGKPRITAGITPMEPEVEKESQEKEKEKYCGCYQTLIAAFSPTKKEEKEIIDKEVEKEEEEIQEIQDTAKEKKGGGCCKKKGGGCCKKKEKKETIDKEVEKERAEIKK